MNRRSLVLLVLCIVALVVAGCLLDGDREPYITDFTDDKVQVSVNYDILGPTPDAAKTASKPVAKELCRSYKKRAEYVSSFRRAVDLYLGTYYFLYRCVGTDIESD